MRVWFAIRLARLFFAWAKSLDPLARPPSPPQIHRVKIHKFYHRENRMASFQVVLTLTPPKLEDSVVKRVAVVQEFGSTTQLGPYSIAIDATSFAVPEPIPDTLGGKSLTVTITDQNAAGLTSSTSVSGTVPVTATPPGAPIFSIDFVPFPTPPATPPA
jgi:hypothetical protein